MPTIVELSATTAKKALFVLRKDGVKVKSYEYTVTSPKGQAGVAKDAGVSLETLIAWQDQIGREPKQFEVDEGKPNEFLVYYRPIKEPRGDATSYANPIAFLDSMNASREQLMEWDDTNVLACLDVDYHDGGMPSEEWLETTVLTSLLPKPYVWHLSPRGLHAFYPAVGALTGAEVAALAAMRWRTLDATAGVEIKRQLRGPGRATLHKFPGYTEINTFVTDFLAASGTVDPSGWLESQGMEVGRRYDHSKCPIEPTAASDNRDPVTVSESGIYCHRCAGVGRQLGRNRAGYAPFSSIIGNGGAGVLSTLVRNRTHWGHAQHVIDSYLGMTGEVAKLAYSAAIKLTHGDVKGVFSPVTDRLVRLEGRWATVAEGYTFPKDIKPILETLPACETPATVCLFQQPTIDLSDFGYPSIQVLRGCKLSTRTLGTSRLVVSSPASWLREYGSVFFPRYVDATKRMPKAEAQGIIETVLPSVDWKYLELLLVARGCNEARVGLPQHLLVSGYSKTGKTSHVQLAAGILGDVVTPVPASDSVEKFRSAVRDASERGSFLSLDEFIKDTLRLNPRMTPEQVFEPLLNFDPEGLSHKMYLGPTALGQIGVCIWTDTHFSEVLHDYTQIARRLHVYKTMKRLDWDTHLAAHGISEVKLVRTVSQQHADACNAILSWVADERFATLGTFHQKAAEMGISTLENSQDFYDMTPKRREFFDLVCQAPDLDREDAKRWPGKGYKLIVRGGDDPLSKAWAYFSDGGKQWADAKRIHEKPFAEILGKDDPVHFDSHAHGSRLAVRFRQGTFISPSKVNEEIVK